MTGRVRFLPLAITRADAGSGCVGAVTADGAWIRPQPVGESEVEGPARRYHYGAWHEAVVSPADDPGARPEDHTLSGPVGPPRWIEDERVLHQLLRSRPDADVASALGGERSLGLVRARVSALYLKASLARKWFLRLVFTDASGASHDWIVPEVALGALARPHRGAEALDRGWAAAVVGYWQEVETFLTLGLTRPNHRFPGRFRGCHPLVVGIHTIPDYRPAFASRGAA
jgi:hypothetical protein